MEKSYNQLLDDLISISYKNPNECLEETALRYVLDDDHDSLKVLLEESPQFRVNGRNTISGRSLLHEACLHGRKNVVKLLLTNEDVNIHIPSCMGRCSALHFAVSGNHRSIVFLLLTHGANELYRDRFGCSPLHYVRSINVARVIFQYGGQVLDYSHKRKSVLDSVMDRIATEHETKDNNSKELVTYLKKRADHEYRQQLRKVNKRPAIK